MSQSSLTKYQPKQVLKPEEMWIVVYGTDKFYMTPKEKEILMAEINRGAKVVEINGRVFTDKFLYLLPASKQDESAMLEEGKWRCEYGNWHEAETNCKCGVTYVDLPDGTIKTIRETPQERWEKARSEE